MLQLLMFLRSGILARLRQRLVHPVADGSCRAVDPRARRTAVSRASVCESPRTRAARGCVHSIAVVCRVIKRVRVRTHHIHAAVEWMRVKRTLPMTLRMALHTRRVTVVTAGLVLRVSGAAVRAREGPAACERGDDRTSAGHGRDSSDPAAAADACARADPCIRARGRARSCSGGAKATRACGGGCGGRGGVAGRKALSWLPYRVSILTVCTVAAPCCDHGSVVVVAADSNKFGLQAHRARCQSGRDRLGLGGSARALALVGRPGTSTPVMSYSAVGIDTARAARCVRTCGYCS